MEGYRNKFDLLNKIKECYNLAELTEKFFSYFLGEDYRKDKDKDKRFIHNFFEQMISTLEMGSNGPLIIHQLETTLTTELWFHLIDKALHSSSYDLEWFRAEKEQISSRERRQNAFLREEMDVTMKENTR